MQQNLVVLLADLFNLFEIHPAPCVDYPESETASGKFNTAPYTLRKCRFSASFASSSVHALNMFVEWKLAQKKTNWKKEN